jgi:5-methylcytosine-specific restriction endonuclease McrA
MRMFQQIVECVSKHYHWENSNEYEICKSNAISELCENFWKYDPYDSKNGNAVTFCSQIAFFGFAGAWRIKPIEDDNAWVDSVLNDKISEWVSYQDSLCDKINNRDTHTSVTSYTPQQLYTPKQVVHQSIYDDLLHTPEWESKRNTILNRDGHKCAYCGKTHNLQVHHKYYSKYPNGRKVEPWNYPDEALITLCDNCHKRVHSKKKIKVYYRRYYDNY